MPKTSTENEVDLVARIGDAMATELDTRKSILILCRLAYEGMSGVEAGKEAAARREALAEATMRALAQKYGYSEEEAVEARRTPANRPGGISVSGTAIGHRADAYSDVLAAGLKPDVENITNAFRLTSIGGSKGPRQVVQEEVANGGDFNVAAKREATALTVARRGRGRKPRPAGEVTFEEDALDADIVVAVLNWAVTATFNAEETARISDALANLSAAVNK